MKKSFLLAILIIVCLAVVFAAVFAPLGGNRSKKVSVIIQKGDGLTTISRKLEMHGLIGSRFLFKWTSILLGKRKSFKSGKYEVKGKISTFELINLLDKGISSLLKITIPEGLRVKEVLGILKNTSFNNNGNYSQICNDPEFMKSLGLPANITSLEGFLFPDTYKFSEEISERTIIRTMIRTFFKSVPKNYKIKAEKVGLSYYEAIILASIIEKETSIPSERRIIASVFHNRLKRDMRLQTDPTVIYGIKNFDGNLTRRQLRKRTPYNTYVISGLPPTPIANPGLASLIAAVEPAKTDYLFFVAKGDKTHKFTNNYQDHARAVKAFQKRRKANYKSY